MRKNLIYHDTLSTKSDLQNNSKICATICATRVTAYWWVPGRFWVDFSEKYAFPSAFNLRICRQDVEFLWPRNSPLKPSLLSPTVRRGKKHKKTMTCVGCIN